MKILSLTLLISAALSCGNSSDNNDVEQNIQDTVVSATTTIDESADEQQEMLTGKITKNDLQQAPYNSWFEAAYESYSPSEEELEVIKNNIHEYEIEVFMGTWCGDSRREAPKIFKLLELADYDMDQLEVYAVDRRKSLPENLQVSTEFQMVPTIVFYKNGEEVNRFVEFSQESFEEDIAKIVSGQDYNNPYAE